MGGVPFGRGQLGGRLYDKGEEQAQPPLPGFRPLPPITPVPDFQPAIDAMLDMQRAALARLARRGRRFLLASDGGAAVSVDCMAELHVLESGEAPGFFHVGQRPDEDGKAVHFSTHGKREDAAAELVRCVHWLTDPDGAAIFVFHDGEPAA